MRFRRSGAALSCGRCGTSFAELLPLSLPTRGFVPFNLGFGGSLVVQYNIMMFRDARAAVLWQRVPGGSYPLLRRYSVASGKKFSDA